MSLLTLSIKLTFFPNHFSTPPPLSLSPKLLIINPHPFDFESLFFCTVHCAHPNHVLNVGMSGMLDYLSYFMTSIHISQLHFNKEIVNEG